MDSFGLLGEKLSHSLSPEIHKEILNNINEYNLILCLLTLCGTNGKIFCDKNLNI